MGRPLLNLIGQKFGLLSPVEYLGRRHNSSHWLCQCDCGEQTKVVASALKSGGILSCGCHRRARMAQLTLKHGERGGELRSEITVEYRCWNRMLDRCNRPTETSFKHYGGRGITVCPEWTADFGAFLRDVGRRPSRAYSIERIRVNGHYEPGNCRWATWPEQARNRRNNRIVRFDGADVTLVEASELAGIPYKTVKGRLAHGWSVEEALSLPIDQAKVNAATRRHPSPNGRATRSGARAA